MQNLHCILDILFQTPSNTTHTFYIPPNLSSPTNSKLFHIQRSTSATYIEDPTVIIYPNSPFIHGSITIRPISPSFIQHCNEQILDVKVDFDPASLLNITTILSRPWSLERRLGFRLPQSQAESVLPLVTSSGFNATEYRVYPILEAFIHHTSECPIDMKIEWDMTEHLRRTTIISRAEGFEVQYNVPPEFISYASYYLPDPIPLHPSNSMVIQLNWIRSNQTSDYE